MNMYRNFEVFSGIADASSASAEGRTATLSVVSSAVGARRVYDRRGFPVRSRSLVLNAVGAQAIAELRAFIGRRQGRVTPFWLPSGISDLVALNSAQAGDTNILVKGTSYASVFTSGVRSHLAINGLQVRVTQAIAGANSTALALGSNLGTALTADTPISFLHLYRLAADEVAIEFQGTDFASVTLELVELPNETT